MKNTIYCLEHKKLASKCDHGGHYGIYGFDSIDDLKRIFPEGKANHLNWVIASTSGVHGTYTSLDEIQNSLENLSEDDDDYFNELTCLIVMPRMVCVIYGCIEVKDLEELNWLRGLITSSLEQIKESQQGNTLTT